MYGNSPAPKWVKTINELVNYADTQVMSPERIEVVCKKKARERKAIQEVGAVLRKMKVATII